MNKKIIDEIKPFAEQLHKDGWRSTEADDIMLEFSLTEEEKNAVKEILHDLETRR